MRYTHCFLRPLARIGVTFGLLLHVLPAYAQAPNPPAAPGRAAAPLAAVNPAAAQVPIRTPRTTLRFESGTGGVVTLPSAAANVFVADPKVAEVRPASATTLFVFGVGIGRTTVAAVNSEGVAISEYDVFVRPAAYASADAEATIARLLPGTSIRVTPQNKGLMISGRVASAGEAARAISIARGFTNEGQTIEDQLTVTANVQVTLRVRIAEVSRTVTRNLGIDWQALGSIGSIARLPALALATTGATALGCATGVASLNVSCQGLGFNGLIDALAQDDLARVLAEPNLTVMSGQTASFLAGGEFPIPVGQQNGTITIEFKKFGVSLAFLPTVLSDGRINIKVTPEVSEISREVTIPLIVGTRVLEIPGLRVRRADTTVELGTGQSFAIAGLLQDSVTQGDKGLPGLGEIPILGSLFRSDRFKRNETELVILITPYVVRPLNDPSALRVAGDNYIPPTDVERLLGLRQVGRATPSTPTRVPGKAGFILQ